VTGAKAMFALRGGTVERGMGGWVGGK